MATLTTERTTTAERTTIEKPRIEQILAEDEVLPVDIGLAEDEPEGEITKGFWSKAGTFFGKWSEKHGEHMMKTGYWNQFRI